MKTTFPLETATSVNPEVLQIAQQAYIAHQKGIAIGDWTDFLALMDDDIKFQAPSPDLLKAGIQGKENVAAILQKITTELKLTAQFTLLYPILANATTVAFEVLAQSEVEGKATSLQLIILYKIEHGKIKFFREYVMK